MSPDPTPRVARRGILLHRMLWRWHFYAGMFCIPFVLFLAITGGIYIFRPQIDAAIDRPYDNLAFQGAPASPEAQALAAVGSIPGGRLKAYELTPSPRDAARVIVRAKGEDIRVYVHPRTLEVLKSVPEKARFTRVVHDLHGELLIGKTGSILVELAACWAIVMIVTGLYLWWPRGAQGLAGVLWPRTGLGGRLFWRDLHAVVGLWVSATAMFILLTGLPWTQVWGQGFKAVRAWATPAAAGKADWATAGNREKADDEHAEHRAGAGGHAHHHLQRGAYAALNVLVPAVHPLGLAAPATISPPKSPGAPWTAKSDSQNRPLRQDLTLSPDGQVLSRKTFADKPLIDRAVGVGVAAHEGHLFGLANQLLGLATAIGFAVLSISGAIMWWKRRPTGELGAPQTLGEEKLSLGLGLIILAFAVFLPVLGASLVLVALVEQAILCFLPGVRTWLGLRARPVDDARGLAR